MFLNSSLPETAASLILEALDALPLQLGILDSRYTVVYGNRAWCEFAKQQPGLACGAPYLEIWSQWNAPALADALRERLHGAFQGTSAAPIELTCEDSQGSVWLQVQAAPLLLDGAPHAVVTHIDVTQRKRLDDWAHGGESPLADAIGYVGDACCSLDSNWRFIQVNPAAERILERNGQELLGKNIWDEFPALVDSEVRDAAHRSMSQRIRTDCEFYSRHSPTALEVRVFPAPHGVSVYFRDITDRVRTAQELRKGEEFFRNAFHSSYIGTAILGLDGEILQVNASFCQLVGYREEELLSSNVRTITHPDDLSLSHRMMQRLVNGEVPRYQIVKRYLHREGAVVWVLLSGSLLRDAQGGPQHIITQVQDISDRKRAEEELRRQALTFENISDGVVLTHDGGIILDWNPAAERILGFTRNEILGTNVKTLIASGQSGLLVHIHQELSRLRRWEGEMILRRKDGSDCVCEGVVAPLIDEAGCSVASVYFLRDVTERRHLEAQLQQAQKMEAVGRLAGGVAHDFNNLLTVVNGYSELLLGDIPQDSLQRQRILEIRRAAERAASLTRQLLAYSRRQVLSPRLIDLNTVVEHLAPMLRRLIGEDINFETKLSPCPVWVKADPGQIDQVILNLAVNARDAIPQSGTIAIELSPLEWPQLINGGKLLAPGAYATLSVRDTGIGMNQETQSHIFEPFFTTKEKGQGTGLGLAMVYGIVRQSGGYIQVNSIPGKGSCFTVYLPQVEAPREDAGAGSGALPSIEPGRETLLIVEDEEGVRSLICDVLNQQGYRVLEAANSQEALQHAVHHAGVIHLMVTDVVMPQMGGRELAQRMASLRPRMQVLYMSGYTDDAVVRHGVLESQMAFLQKPFSPAQLRQKVREILNAAPRPRDRA